VQRRPGQRDVEIERQQFEAEMKLGLVVERRRMIGGDSLRQRPSEDIAEGDEVKMQVEGDAIIEAEIFVVEHAVMHEAEAEGDKAAVLSPQEKAHAFGHSSSELLQERFGQPLKLEGRTCEDLLVERERFIHGVAGVVRHGHGERRGGGERLEFAAQIFPHRVAEAAREVVVEASEIESQPRRGHAGDPGTFGRRFFQDFECAAVACRNVFPDDEAGARTAGESLKAIMELRDRRSGRDEVPFAGGATGHQDFQSQEAWKNPAHDPGEQAERRRRGDDQILLDEEARLQGQHFTRAVFEDQHAAIEPERVGDDLVITMIFREMPETLAPCGLFPHFRERGEARADGGGFDHGGGGHCAERPRLPANRAPANPPALTATGSFAESLHPPVISLARLLLLVLLATPLARAERAFHLDRDTFAFSNDTAWKYGVDEQGRLQISLRDKPAEFAHRCFVLARAVLQFRQFARFEPAQPQVSREEYRRRIKQLCRIPVWGRGPREKIVIPGYRDLHDFSVAYEGLLKENLGNWWPTYWRVGNWRMAMGHPRAGQAAGARWLAKSVEQGKLRAIYMSRFPKMNHVVVPYAVQREAGGNITFLAYDPNTPGEPVWVFYRASTRSFEFQPRWYFPGGQVNVMRVYLSPIH